MTDTAPTPTPIPDDDLHGFLQACAVGIWDRPLGTTDRGGGQGSELDIWTLYASSEGRGAAVVNLYDNRSTAAALAPPAG